MLLEEVTVPQLVQFPALYGTAFRRARQAEVLYFVSNRVTILRSGIATFSPESPPSLAGGPPLLGCPRAATLHICRLFLYPQPENALYRGDRAPCTTDTVMYCNVRWNVHHRSVNVVALCADKNGCEV